MSVHITELHAKWKYDVYLARGWPIASGSVETSRWAVRVAGQY